MKCSKCARRPADRYYREENVLFLLCLPCATTKVGFGSKYKTIGWLNASRFTSGTPLTVERFTEGFRRLYGTEVQQHFRRIDAAMRWLSVPGLLVPAESLKSGVALRLEQEERLSIESGEVYEWDHTRGPAGGNAELDGSLWYANGPSTWTKDCWSFSYRGYPGNNPTLDSWGVQYGNKLDLLPDYMVPVGARPTQPQVPNKPEPPCPRCERLAAPEHVTLEQRIKTVDVPVSGWGALGSPFQSVKESKTVMVAKCKCWWCANEFEAEV